MLKLNDIKVENESIEPTVSLALTDTGASLLYLDPEDYVKLISKICKGLVCFQTPDEPNVYAIKNCEPSDIPFIWLKIDRHQYKLAPQAYVISLVYPDGTYDCVI
jgi:hypothetical protein